MRSNELTQSFIPPTSTPLNGEIESETIQTSASPSQPYPSPSSSPSAGPCTNFCRCCNPLYHYFPCSHILTQLGLTAYDSEDGWRVYTRFTSLMMMCSSFLYFLLLITFLRWFNYDGAIALLATTFSCHTVLSLFGWYASRRTKMDNLPSLTSSASFASLSSSAPSSSLIPPHPRILTIVKWSSILFLPLTLLCFFFAIFLGGCMVGWITTDTSLTASSRQQVISVLLLGGVSLITLLLQSCFFLFASAWARADRDDTSPDEADWVQEQQAAAAAASAAYTATAGVESSPIDGYRLHEDENGGHINLQMSHSLHASRSRLDAEEV